MAAKPNGHKPQLMMTYQAVATACLRLNDIHEGFWRVALTFGQVSGVNANMNGKLIPSAFVPVMGISLVRDEEPNDLTVDASVVNPLKRIVTPAGMSVN